MAILNSSSGAIESLLNDLAAYTQRNKPSILPPNSPASENIEDRRDSFTENDRVRNTMKDSLMSPKVASESVYPPTGLEIPEYGQMSDVLLDAVINSIQNRKR